MKPVLALFLSITLAGCASDKQWFPPGGGLYGRSAEVVDHEKCRKLGFKPGTEAYGNCRLKLEQIRAIERKSTISRVNRSRADTSSVPTTTTILDAKTGRMITCTGSESMKTCF